MPWYFNNTSFNINLTPDNLDTIHEILASYKSYQVSLNISNKIDTNIVQKGYFLCINKKEGKFLIDTIHHKDYLFKLKLRTNKEDTLFFKPFFENYTCEDTFKIFLNEETQNCIDINVSLKHKNGYLDVSYFNPLPKISLNNKDLHINNSSFVQLPYGRYNIKINHPYYNELIYQYHSLMTQSI